MEICEKRNTSTYYLEEVKDHGELNDCWIVINDKIYDITNFLYKHPGSMEILMEHAGSDATAAFCNAGHSKYAVKLLDDYEIGELVEDQKFNRNF